MWLRNHVVCTFLALLQVPRDLVASRFSGNKFQFNLGSDKASRVAAKNENGLEWSEPDLAWPIDKVQVLLDRHHQDLAVIHEVRETFKPTRKEKDVPNELAPKVAILFMVKDDVEQHDLWMKFFQEADAAKEAFSVYFHQYAPDLESSHAAREIWKTKIQASFIPTVKTGWGQLVGVMFALLWEALRDPANAQFVFSSEGTVPLKSAPYVYKYLIHEGSDVRSKVCFRKAVSNFNRFAATMEPTRSCSYVDPLQAVKLPVAQASTRYEDTHIEAVRKGRGWKGRVRKHEQWVILARRHAVDVINNSDRALKKFLAAVLRAPQPSMGDPCATGASDESVVATALLAESELQLANAPLNDTLEELRLYGVDSECTTFTFWRHCWRGTALAPRPEWKRVIDDTKTIVKGALNTKPKLWFDARTGLMKGWNDSPRDFGLKDATPKLAYLSALVNTGLLFGRKFGNDETGRASSYLSTALPPLWYKWDREFEGRKLSDEHRAWPITDSRDPRVATSIKERIPPAKNIFAKFVEKRVNRQKAKAPELTDSPKQPASPTTESITEPYAMLTQG